MFWRIAGLRPHPTISLDAPNRLRLPYAFAIAGGLLVRLWWR
jgi:hypothetical protein